MEVMVSGSKLDLVNNSTFLYSEKNIMENGKFNQIQFLRKLILLFWYTVHFYRNSSNSK